MKKKYKNQNLIIEEKLKIIINLIITIKIEIIIMDITIKETLIIMEMTKKVDLIKEMEITIIEIMVVKED